MGRKFKLTVLLLGIAVVLGACGSKKEVKSASSTVESTTVSSSTDPVEFKLHEAAYRQEEGKVYISGTAENGSKIILKRDGKEITNNTAADGAYRLTIDMLLDGVASVAMIVTDGETEFPIEIKTKKGLEDELAKKEAEEAAAKKKEEEEAAAAKKKADEEAAAAKKKADEEAAAAEAKRQQQAADEAAAELASYNTGITFENLARNPDTYMAKKVLFTGKVLQVIKGDGYSQFRMAVDDNYDKVIYLEISEDQLSNNRLLEDDNITIRGVSYGELTYESTMGGEITVPSVIVKSFTLN